MDFDALPAFIKKDIMRYKRKMKAKIIKNKLIKKNIKKIGWKRKVKKMKILDKYVYRSLILPTIFGVSIFTFILMLNVLIEVMEKIFTSDLGLVSTIDYFFIRRHRYWCKHYPWERFGRNAGLREFGRG